MNQKQVFKVTANHLARDAYLYVRQATMCQGLENADSIERQYDLIKQATTLGWPIERVIVIDSDIGQSGFSQKHRPGLRQVVRQIEIGAVGIVMALDPFRFTRNVSDWHRLWDACAMSHTLLLLQDQLYEPADPKDRFLWGPDPITEWTKADAEH